MTGHRCETAFGSPLPTCGERILTRAFADERLDGIDDAQEWPEVVSPLRHAVRRIDDHEVDADHALALSRNGAKLLGEKRFVLIDRVPDRLAMAAVAGVIPICDVHVRCRLRPVKLTAAPCAARNDLLVAPCGHPVDSGRYGGLTDKNPFGGAAHKGLRLRMVQTHVHRWTCDVLRRIERPDRSAVSHHADVSLEQGPDVYRFFRECVGPHVPARLPVFIRA